MVSHRSNIQITTIPIPASVTVNAPQYSHFEVNGWFSQKWTHTQTYIQINLHSSTAWTSDVAMFACEYLSS